MTTAEKLADIITHLDDAWWRLTSGKLYKIIIKGDNDEDSLVIDFIPNNAQLTLLKELWNRNDILKARQLGFTTLISILWLDTALFSAGPIRCGIIAQDREAAEVIFRDKVKFAYDHLPDFIKSKTPLAKDSASELMFAHNKSSIRVATSMRSGTIHRLHISEFGKICAKFPDKAAEVVTGSIPAVPKSGILVIESTAEGQEGEYYKITQRAMAIKDSGSELSEKDYKFHFFPWYVAPEYTIDLDLVCINSTYQRYFDELEAKIGSQIAQGQRAWYVATCESDFSGDVWKMRQEYPSTPEEAFQVSTDGCYYAEQMASCRKSGRIIRGIPVLPVPVNTFWDIGRGDMTAIWLHQFATMQHRFLRYYEESGEDLIHYVQYLQRMSTENGYVYGTHYIPHEAGHRRIGATHDTSKTIQEMLQALWPGQRFQIVPVVTNINAGIQAVRSAFSSACFDDQGCSEGIKRLDNYKKRWNKTTGSWSDEPLHDANSHGADAFRQWAQETGAGNTFGAGPVKSYRPRSSSDWRL
ncbi:MAG: hypothetical protein Q8L15_18465 [Methylobacter sp.]|nr:hypothetical protein [Methylobacter sp.]